MARVAEDALGNPETDRRRPADKEELLAWKQWKQHRINRADYEQVVAYRRFVHGEMSAKEYHATIRQIRETWTGTRGKGP